MEFSVHIARYYNGTFWMNGTRYGRQRARPDMPTYFSSMKTKEWRGYSKILFAMLPIHKYHNLTTLSSSLHDAEMGGFVYRFHDHFFQWTSTKGIDPFDLSEEDILAYELEEQ